MEEEEQAPSLKDAVTEFANELQWARSLSDVAIAAGCLVELLQSIG